MKHVDRSAKPERLRSPRPESPTLQPHRNSQWRTDRAEIRRSRRSRLVHHRSRRSSRLRRSEGRPAPERQRDHVRRRRRPARPPETPDSSRKTRDSHHHRHPLAPRPLTWMILRDGYTCPPVRPTKTMKRRARVTGLVSAQGRGGPRATRSSQALSANPVLDDGPDHCVRDPLPRSPVGRH